jgi:RNA polymerase sigma-70 factor (ECF subfamily)
VSGQAGLPAEDAEGAEGREGAERANGLLDVYDRALPVVYGYLLSRCGAVALAEDLTAEAFLAAAHAVRRGTAPSDTNTPWLLGIARHKLADHWRRQAREERSLHAVEGAARDVDDPWDARLDALRARQTLDRLDADHRAALTLRYVDDLPVGQVAELLHRSLHATESLLARARDAFRRAYNAEGGA